MGSEIYDVEISLTTNTKDVIGLLHATKVTSKKNKDTKTTLTFQGDVSTSAKNTGGTITIERLNWPESVQDAIDLERVLESELITSVTCSGRAYTSNGEMYRKTITGSNVIITSDEDEWSPSDGVTQKLELAVNTLTRESTAL